jgi:hypothetical protein
MEASISSLFSRDIVIDELTSCYYSRRKLAVCVRARHLRLSNFYWELGIGNQVLDEGIYGQGYDHYDTTQANKAPRIIYVSFLGIRTISRPRKAFKTRAISLPASETPQKRYGAERASLGRVKQLEVSQRTSLIEPVPLQLTDRRCDRYHQA